MDLKNICVDPLPRDVVDWCEQNSIGTAHRFCAYLEYIDGEIVERVFGTRRYKKFGVKISEVMRHSTGDSSRIVRNLLYRTMCGYTVVYDATDLYDRTSGYGFKVFSASDFNIWYPASGNVGCSYVYVNPQLIFTIDEFKYCGYTSGPVTSYLNAYRKDHSLEFFGKIGLGLSPALMKKAKQDAAFRKWLFQNRNGVKIYGPSAALYSYKTGKDLKESHDFLYFKRQFDLMVAKRIPEIRGTKLDRARVLDYVDTNNIDYALYDDYLKAVKALGLDLRDTKNIYPRDFMRMHDLRASEYAAKLAAEDRVKRAQLYEDFKIAAQHAKNFEVMGDKYVLVAPEDVSDLVKEGDALSHCVGRMGYDKKMADGISLIMFVRKASDPTTPYVTLEWRFDKKCLNQCYGHKDSRPDDETMAFVNSWASMMLARKEASNG